MMVNNLGFELLTQYRRWRGQYLKLAIFLFGFALTAAFLSIALRLSSMLFYENPSWTNVQKPLYTMGRLSEDKRLVAVSKQAIHQLKALPMVSDVSWLVFREFDFTLNSNKLNNIKSAIFSDNLIGNLGIDFHNSTNASGAWVTERFWREFLKSDANIIGKILSRKQIPQGIRILGVLDKKYNQVGINNIDIWFSEQILRHSTPFVNDIMIDRFLQAAPMYYAVFSAEKLFDIQQSKKHLESIDLSVKGMSFSQSPLPLVIFSGINFDPKSQQHMVLLWQLLLSLIIALFLILAFSLFSICSSKAIVFADEYKTLRLLGAQPFDLFRSALLFAFFKVIVISVLSLLCLFVLIQVVQNSTSYQSLFSDKTLSVSILSFISAIAMVAISVVLCSLIPLVNLLKRGLFTRMTNARVSLPQKVIAASILVIQLSVAIITIYTLASIANSQWQQYKGSNINLLVNQVNIDSGHFEISWRQVLEKAQQNDPSAAVMSTPFEKLYAYTLKDQRVEQAIDIKTAHVSNLFFSLLGVNIQHIENNWESGVIINRALANHLRGNNKSASLIGTVINYGVQDRPYTITGISDNIPHWGRRQSILPTLYLPISSLDKDTLNNFSILSSKKEDLDSNSDLIRWIQAQAPNVRIQSVSSLAATLAPFDQQSNDLLWCGLVITLIIITGIFSGLWYQVLAQLRLDKQSICVLLAIGATDNFIIVERCKKILYGFVVALITCLLFYKLMGTTLINLDFFALLTALVTNVLLCLIATLAPLVKLLKTPIQQALKDL
jgi:hypothetical protein